MYFKKVEMLPSNGVPTYENRSYLNEEDFGQGDRMSS
jgi:hypothetical protein